MDSLEFSFEVSDAQEELVRLNLRIKSLIESFTGVENFQEMDSLNGQIRGQLDRMNAGIENLRRLAQKQKNTEARSMLIDDVSSHENQITSCYAAFKTANLGCIGRLNKLGREALMGKTTNRFSTDPSEKLDKEEMVQESGRVTDHLASISRHLAATVERSARTVDELAESSKAISDAHNEFKYMGSVIGQSRKLITKYGRREVTDRVLILFAFAFFCSVVFYILRKRVFGPFDPFSLLWSTVVASIKTVIKFAYDYGNDNKADAWTMSDNTRAEL